MYHSFRLSVILALLIITFQAPGQWVQHTNGMFGGNVLCLALHGTKLFAGTPNGVYRSDDGGATWTFKSSGMENSSFLPSVNSILVNGTSIFAAVFHNGGNSGGVFVSNDDGEHWTSVLAGFQCRHLGQAGGNLYAGGFGGVYISTNNGANWTRSTNLGGSFTYSMVTVGNNVVVGVQGQGALMTSDNGVTWTPVNNGLPQPLTKTNVLNLANVGSTIFAGTPQGLFSTTNNGANWAAVAGLAPGSIAMLQGVTTNLWAAVLDAGISVTGNNGATWSTFNTGLSAIEFVQCLIPVGSDLFIGTGGSGVFKSSDNGVSWSQSTLGMTNLTAMALLQTETAIVAGTFGGAFRSTDNGNTWAQINSGLNNSYVTSLVAEGSELVAATWKGVSLTGNNGTNWSLIGLNGTGSTTLASDSSTIYAATNGGFYKTSNNGVTWQHPALFSSYGLTSVAVDNNYVYVGSGDGSYLSSDNGATWSAINSGPTNVYQIALSGSTALAASSEGVFQLNAARDTWTNVSPENGITSLAGNDNYALAGDVVGTVYFSVDHGSTWSAVSKGIPTFSQVQILSLSTDLTDVYIGTLDMGVWSRPFSDFLLSFSIAPGSGSTGTVVTITGTGFDITPSNNIVSFNGVPAIITASTPTSLTVSVPAGATTGKVTVKTPAQIAISAANFVVSNPPVVTTISPSAGVVGDKVTITGLNFSASPAEDAVSFNATAASVVTSTSTSIVTVVPPNAITGQIAVTVGAATALSPQTFTVLPALIFSPLPFETYVEGKVVEDIVPTITANSPLDLKSIRITQSPASGAPTSIIDGVLTIDYAGHPFIGQESITLEACAVNGQCYQQLFDIVVSGDIVIYNALSPNGDGKNEFLFLKYIDNLPSARNNQVTIYNRWGDPVFSVTEYDNATRIFAGIGEDGEKLPPGTYYYRIDLPMAGKAYNGFIQLKY